MAPETNVTEDGIKGSAPSGRYQWPSKGRRAERKLREEALRVIVRNTHDTSRLVKMAPRAFRRAKQGDDFRPVYHHGIPTKLEHSAVIAAMKVHKNGRRQAARWQPQVATARACVSFGLAVKKFLINMEIDRRARVKAAALCITS